MKTKTEDQEYTSKGKEIIRNQIIQKIKETTNASILELYGSGIMYNLIKQKTNASIRSIDNNPKIGKKMEGIPDTFFGSINQYCKLSSFTHNILFLDYCGLFVESARNDLEVIPKIMQDEGTMYITLYHGRECYVQKGTIREDIERLNDYTIKDLLAENGILAKQISVFKYESIPLYKGKQKRKTDKPSIMKVYEYQWKRVPKEELIMMERFTNKAQTIISEI